MILVLEIVNTHGVTGEMKALHFTNGEEFFKKVKTLYTKDGTGINILSWRLRKGSVLLRIEGVNSMTEAEKWRRTELFAKEEDLPKLPEGEYYFYMLKGLSCILPSGEKIGKVKDVIESPAANLLEIEKDNGAKILVPNIPAFVEKVDLDTSSIYILPIEGLIENEI